MKGIVIILLILLGIFTWNETNFKNDASGYEVFASVIFVLDIVGGFIICILMGVFEDD